jgi:adenosylcobinamide-GDP ribazoletransferase
MLEIMKDSRSGPMGVAAVVLVMALKITALGSLDGPLRSMALVLAPLAGRSSLVTAMSVLPYARPDGLCTAFHARKRHAFTAAAITVALGGIAAGSAGLCRGLTSVVAALAVTGYTYRKIGGMTGDTLGASCEIAELAPLLAAAAWTGSGVDFECVDLKRCSLFRRLGLATKQAKQRSIDEKCNTKRSAQANTGARERSGGSSLR